ncbi:MAG: inorganic diphosphatase [Anaeroplasmataceae bacterium]|nr:inorganic diphosphatase [Anaeroplasmataceae bacterium]MDE5856293.1 inorganic diphosphatase [Anaeroplasmataceae bacterium]MDE6047503.1 inorganic diphosphatase [Anaeroplasmataceae bacterium]MDE6241375.1 inorganic diphosphatase [Anaeroplasmataceae bacterium]MDE6415182.1 inorganic diphosphatase [Anaeroplasmataceae bacterium]
MHNIWHDIDDDRIKKDNFIACIEIPKGSKKKYELDKETGLIILDRILYTSTHYPANYGFIPRTYSQDKDPLDVLVLCNETFDPLVLVKCFPIGVVKMFDQQESDEKIIAVCQTDPMMNNYRDISELPQHYFDEMTHFFSVYKTLEGKDTVVTEICGREEAERIIEESINAYKNLYIK